MRLFATLIFFLSVGCIYLPSCQSNIALTGKVKSPSFDKEIASLLSFNIPALSVKEAKQIPDAIYLDARESNEYIVSHIPGATWIGSDHWMPQTLQSVSKEQSIIVYCSVGYRSEKIATKIKALGYQRVYNLYGSIFEWANEGNSLVNNDGQPTKELHTYNKKWSKWVTNPGIQKIW